MNRALGWCMLSLLIGPMGCVSTELRRARAVQDALTGQTRAQLVACAGQPAEEGAAGDQTVLTYYRTCGMLEQGFPTTRGTMARALRHGCRATVELDRERVSRVVFVPTPEGADYEMYHCEEIFAACLAAGEPR